jgi:hypothetical protein
MPFQRLAEDKETIVIVPVVLKVVRVQLALVVVPVEVRDVAMTVGVRERSPLYARNAIRITTPSL